MRDWAERVRAEGYWTRRALPGLPIFTRDVQTRNLPGAPRSFRPGRHQRPILFKICGQASGPFKVARGPECCVSEFHETRCLACGGTLPTTTSARSCCCMGAIEVAGMCRRPCRAEAVRRCLMEYMEIRSSADSSRDVGGSGGMRGLAVGPAMLAR